MTREHSNLDAAAVTQQVERVIRSRVFARAARSQRLLRFLVDAAMAGTQHTVKEYTLATEVFDRDPSYDPALEATVRVEAGRMRNRLRDYYHEEGKDDPLLIEVPRGGYAAVLTVRDTPATPDRPLEVGAEPPEAPGGATQDVASASVPEPLFDAADATSPAIPFHRMVRLSPWSVSLVLLCGLLLGCGIWAASRPRNHRPAIHSLAVLPLRNLSGDAGQEYFADGTTDELTTELARLPNLRVISWNSALQEKNTAKPLEVIGRELRADAIVEGSVALSGDRLRINAQLIDTRTDAHLWAASFEGSASEAVALEDAAARGIVAHLQSIPLLEELPGGNARDLAIVNPAAHDAYLRGKNYFDRRRGLTSEEEFRHAIEFDPKYASAYAGLALALESEALLGEAPTEISIPKAMSAAEQSLQLDPQNGDALIARGSIEALFLWNWAAAERDLTRGVRLSPGNSFGQLTLSIYFDAIGQPAEAVRHMQSAVDIDPLSFYMARHYGSALFYARRYDQALRQLQFARNLNPDSAGTVDHWISDAYEKKGMYADAVRYDLLEVQDNAFPVDATRLLATYRGEGWQAYWKSRVELIKRTEKPGPCQSYEVGLAAIRAGEHDEALTALKTATERHCYWMTVIRTDPLFDDLRGDPRFDKIVAELHLP